MSWMPHTPSSTISRDAFPSKGFSEDLEYVPITDVLEFISRPLDYLSAREVGYESIRRMIDNHHPADSPSPVIQGTCPVDGSEMEPNASHSVPNIDVISPSNLTDSRLCTTPTLPHDSTEPYVWDSAKMRFVAAVKSNRLDDLREALLHSQVMIDDFRPIVYASMKGFDGIVSYLYALGDSLTIDEFHAVAKYGQNPTILKTILKHNDVNAKNDLGGCALFFSLVNHNYKMSDYLLTASPDIEINPVDSDGFRMTRAFLYLGDKEVVSWMISRGYRFDNPDDRPLETTVLGMNPSVELVKLILEHSAREFAVLEARKVLKKLDSSELLSNPTIRNIFRLLKRYSYK